MVHLLCKVFEKSALKLRREQIAGEMLLREEGALSTTKLLQASLSLASSSVLLYIKITHLVLASCEGLMWPCGVTGLGDGNRHQTNSFRDKLFNLYIAVQ